MCGAVYLHCGGVDAHESTEVLRRVDSLSDDGLFIANLFRFVVALLW